MRAYLKLIPLYLFLLSSVALSGQDEPQRLHQDDGLWAYFSGRELSGVNESPFRLPETDASLNGITGAPDLEGQANGSFYFNHPDDFMVITNSIRTPHQSVAFHFKSDGVSPGTLCGYEAGGFLISMAENGKLDVRLEVSPLLVYHYQSTKNYADGAWHHLVVSFGLEGLQVWLDGAEAFRDNRFASAPGIHYRTGDLYFGPMPGQLNYFNGRLQDIMLYNRQLPPVEVRVLSSVARPRFVNRLGSGEVFRVGFDENQVGNEASVAVPRTLGSYSLSGIMPGRSARAGDRAAKLNGRTNRVSIPRLVSPDSYSIGGWFSTVSTQSARLLELDAGTVSMNLEVDTTPPSPILGGSMPTGIIVESSSLADGVWHSFLLTSDLNNGIHLFLDGREVTKMPFYDGGPGGLDLLFGGASGAEAGFFDGLLDDLIVYNRALSPAEVKALWPPGNGTDNTRLYDCFEQRDGTGLLLVAGNYGNNSVRADIKEQNGTLVIKKWQLAPGKIEVRAIETKCGCDGAKVTWR